jgi:hypothetical protein
MTAAGLVRATAPKWIDHSEADALPGAGPSAQTRRASEAFGLLSEEYARTSSAQDVSFRQLVGPIPVNDLSHSIHPYPARVLRQIPRFFLHCEQLAKPGDVVLDPFCGSGTVLVEARAAGVHGWGIDCNPFARLLSEVKTTPLDATVATRSLSEILSRAKASRAGITPDVVNVDLWFSGPVKRALARLYRAIVEADLRTEVHQYLLVTLALTADRCSLRDTRIPVPVRRKDWKQHGDGQTTSDVWVTFDALGRSIASRLAAVPQPALVSTVVEGDDASQAPAIFAGGLSNRLQRPRLILTSPPYGAAQKYIRSSSLALGWTGLATSSELAGLERGLIGREHLHKDECLDLTTPPGQIARDISRVASDDEVRAAVYANYFRSMDTAFKSLISLLEPGGILVFIAGTNVVAGELIETHAHLESLALRYGMVPILQLRDTIRGRVLLTKRALGGVPLHAETVHVLRKPAA